MGLRGVERAEPGGVLVRHAGGVLPAVRRLRARGQVGRSGLAGRRRLRRRRAGFGKLLSHVGDWGRRLTSCPHTSTGTCRWTCGRCSGRSGGPDADRWTEWGTTPTHFHHVGDTVFAAAFLLLHGPRWAGSRRCRTGWPPTISRSFVARLRSCSTAGSGCCRWGTWKAPVAGAGPAGRAGWSRLPVAVSGDGAGAGGGTGRTALGRADRDPGPGNVTLDQGKACGVPPLARRIRLRVSVPPGTV